MQVHDALLRDSDDNRDVNDRDTDGFFGCRAVVNDQYHHYGRRDGAQDGFMLVAGGC
jgi:hypothetical protein